MLLKDLSPNKIKTVLLIFILNHTNDVNRSFKK